jgi:hypothetical protein
MFPLLAPIRYSSICALGSERFELRTAGLGCQVSTITFLTAVVAVLSTVFGVLVLWLLAQCVECIGFGVRARKGGYVVYPSEEERYQGDVWVRRGETWGKWWRRIRGEQKEFEVEDVDEGSTRGTARSWWGSGNGRENGHQATERRPLLDGRLSQ